MLGPGPSKGCDLMLRMTEGRALGGGVLSVVETAGFVTWRTYSGATPA